MDNTKGISMAISRFNNIVGDSRKKILISPKKWFGNGRMSSLRASGATFIKIDDIFTDSVLSESAVQIRPALLSQ